MGFVVVVFVVGYSRKWVLGSAELTRGFASRRWMRAELVFFSSVGSIQPGLRITGVAFYFRISRA